MSSLRRPSLVWYRGKRCCLTLQVPRDAWASTVRLAERVAGRGAIAAVVGEADVAGQVQSKLVQATVYSCISSLRRPHLVAFQLLELVLNRCSHSSTLTRPWP